MTEFSNDQHIPTDDLTAYADGELLTADERQEIEQHLATCEACREELESLRAVSSLLADLPEPELPRSFRLTADDIAPEPDSSGAPEPVPIAPWLVRNQSFFRYAGLAAAVLLVVLVTVDLVSDTEDEAVDTFTTMEDAAVPEEDAAPEMEDEPVDEPAVDIDEDVAPDAVEDDPVSDEALDAAEEEAAPPAIEDDREAVDEDRPVADTEADDTDDPVVEPDAEEPDEDVPEPTIAPDDDDGLSTLQIAAIGLGVVSIALLLVGFVLPRWWSSSAR